MGEGMPDKSKKTESEPEVDMSYVEMATGEKAPQAQKAESSETPEISAEFPEDLGNEYVSKISETTEAIYKKIQTHPEIKDDENAAIFMKHLNHVKFSFSGQAPNTETFSLVELNADTNPYDADSLNADIEGYKNLLSESSDGPSTLKTLESAIKSQIAYFEAVKSAIDATVSEIEVKKRLAGNAESQDSTLETQ
jgi:hypothetical protein